MSDDRTLDRRQWLKELGAAATAAALLPNVAACGESPAADGDPGPDTGTDDATADVSGSADSVDTPGPAPALQPVRGDGSHPFHYVDTVVIVQMENRSFDHYFGALSLLEGRSDVDGLVAGMSNPGPAGMDVPIRHLTSEYVIEPDPPHSHSSALLQWNSGANDGFVDAYLDKLPPGQQGLQDLVMGYHVREQLPTLYGLADGFTLCDRWFCSVLGPTWPNRFYSHIGSSEGQTSNDHAIEGPTLYKKHMQAGGSFGVYSYSPIHFTSLVGDLWDVDYPQKLVDDFVVDAAAGKLPNICIVEPDYTLNDDHPPQDVRLGQQFLGTVYEALRTSPQWERCLMLVFYDEHGGFFDHVAPPESKGEDPSGAFGRMGFRVPALVAGGLVRRGHVLHETIDHASVPRLLAEVFGYEHLNERCRLAGDLSLAMDLELTLEAKRPAPPELPPIDVSFAEMRDQMKLPFGQPELETFVRRRFGLRDGSWSEKLRRLERWLEVSERLGKTRVS